MTDLISTPIDTDEGGTIAAGQLQHLPPQTLIIGDNVRTDAKIDADFLASIRQLGVGSVFRWRTDTTVSSAFDTVPLYLARRFFRFSWRIREPYGCAAIRSPCVIGLGRFTSRQPNQIPWPLRRR